MSLTDSQKRHLKDDGKFDNHAINLFVRNGIDYDVIKALQKTITKYTLNPDTVNESVEDIVRFNMAEAEMGDFEINNLLRDEIRRIERGLPVLDNRQMSPQDPDEDVGFRIAPRWERYGGKKKI